MALVRCVWRLKNNRASVFLSSVEGRASSVQHLPLSTTSGEKWRASDPSHIKSLCLLLQMFVFFLIIPEPLLCFQLSIYRSLYIQSKQSNLFQRSVKEITSSPLSCGRNPLNSPKQQRAKGFKRVDTHHRALKYSPPRSPRAHSHCYKLAHACQFVEKNKRKGNLT